MSEKPVFSGRKLSVDGGQLIGSGYYSNVYLLDDETVVKVLKHGDMKEAEREILLAKWAFSKGIPTAISYDVVDVDGHPGLVYESLGRGNLLREITGHPENFEEIMDRYTALLRTINAVSVEDNRLPKAIDVYRNQLENIRDIITEDEYIRMSALLDTVPVSNNLVHGDCQIKNVRVVKGELFLIDMDSIRCGDCIFELSSLYSCYKLFGEMRGTEIDPLFQVPALLLNKILDGILPRYFSGISDGEREENIKKIALLSYMFMIFWVKDQMKSDDRALRIMYGSFRKYLPEVNDLKLTL